MTENNTHSGPLDPECCGLSPFLQLLPPILTPSPSSSFPFSHAFFWFPCSCLSWHLCTLSSSARNPSPTHHHMLLPSRCHLSFNAIFSESSCTIHWPMALNLLHPCIFIISFLGHFKCVIVDHPLGCETDAEMVSVFTSAYTTPSDVECREGSVKYIFTR